MTIEKDPAAPRGLVKRVRGNVTTLFDERATNADRAVAGVKATAALSAAGTAAYFGVSELGSLAGQHAAAIHAVMASDYPTVAGWSLALGGYLFTSTGAGMALDRRAGVNKYGTAHRQFVSRRLGKLGMGTGLIAGVAVGSAVAATVAEHLTGMHGATELINDAGLIGTCAGGLAVAAGLGARLARGPKPRQAPALTE